MQPTGDLRGDAVHVGGDARQRFFDSRGYGRPLEGNSIALSRVEAAHLLFRGDLSGVALPGAGSDDPTTVGFERFFVDSAAAVDRFAVRYLVYSDLRDRGFYLSPARDPWPGGDADVSDGVDLVAYERGSTPDTGNVHYAIRVVGEREPVPASGLAGRTLAVVDEESDITYFGVEQPEIEGGTDYEPPETLRGVLLSDRVVVWGAPPALYEHGFYGQPLTGRAAAVENALQLSLLEAASLAADGVLRLDEVVAAGDRAAGIGGDANDGAGGANNVDDGANNVDDGEDDASENDLAAVVARGRTVEGDRFDRRLATYRDLRGRDAVPKTGFKFGADFRTYLDVETVEDLPHSEHLVRVVEPDHAFAPRELSLDVRLAGGVRKELLFALTEGGGSEADDDGSDGNAADIEWLSVGRLTP